MKRLVRNKQYIINMEVVVYHPIFSIMKEENEVAASRDVSKYNWPEGPVISKDKEKITQKMKDDFKSFMINIEDFCEDHLGLIGTYKNVSDDDSYYYNYLAKDANGDIILDYRARLRISNHDASSSPEQKKHKKSELDSDKLNDLLSKDEINNLRTYYKFIRIDDETYSSYEEAIDPVLDEIEHAVEVMRKNERYRKKKPVPDRYKGEKGFEAITEEVEGE